MASVAGTQSEIIMDEIPSKEDVQALDGREFAMLSTAELSVLNFYRDRGRKYGVCISIESNADAGELGRAPSRLQADEILRRARSTIRVTIAN